MRKFVVLSTARSGTNVLNSALSQHDNCVSAGEYFDSECIPEIANRDGAEVAEELFANNQGALAVGFKLFPFNATSPPLNSVWKYIQQPEVRVIHSMRHNTFRQILSHELGGLTGQWTSYNKAKSVPAKLYWPPGKWLEKIRQRRRREAELWNHSKHNPYLRVFYEDLCRDYRHTMRSIWAFIGVPESDVLPRISKQNRKPLSDHILNLDEVRKFMDTTEYGWMLKAEDAPDIREVVTDLDGEPCFSDTNS